MPWEAGGDVGQDVEDRGADFTACLQMAGAEAATAAEGVG